MRGELRIELTRGMFALVSEDDFEAVSQLRWSAFVPPKRRTAYAVRNCYSNGKRTTQKMHRLIAERMGLDVDGRQIDHINGNGLDNRRENLRVADAYENARNVRPQRGTSSGYKGVHWNTTDRKWHARITSNGKRRFLGAFDRAEDAAAAYDRECLSLHGAFGRPNGVCR